MQRPDRSAIEVLSGVGESIGRFWVEPRRALDQHRPGGVGGVAPIAERQRRSTFAAQKQPRLALRIEHIHHLARRGLDREDGQRIWGVEGDRPAAAQRRDRPRHPRVAIQIAISQISGTWSDGRSQLRQGSSTECPARWPASSGEAHIWSSRRPRSFLVQSGER